MDDQVRFKDADAYSSHEEGLTFKTIVIEQVRAIVRIGSGEFHAGSYNFVPIGPDKYEKQYTPSTMQCYCNAVDALQHLLADYLTEKQRLELEGFLAEESGLRAIVKGAWVARGRSQDWRPDYYLNLVPVSQRKFTWLCAVLHVLGYLEVGSFEDLS
jgi:hypothetical protein